MKTSLQRKLIKHILNIYIYTFSILLAILEQCFSGSMLGLFLGVGKPVAASYCVYCSLSDVIYVTLLFQTRKIPFYALCGRQLSKERILHLFRQI